MSFLKRGWWRRALLRVVWRVTSVVVTLALFVLFAAAVLIGGSLALATILEGPVWLGVLVATGLAAVCVGVVLVDKHRKRRGKGSIFDNENVAELMWLTIGLLAVVVWVGLGIKFPEWDNWVRKERGWKLLLAGGILAGVCVFLVRAVWRKKRGGKDRVVDQKASEDERPPIDAGELTDMEMVFVKGGTFTMGCTPEQADQCERDEKPAHRVTLSDYYIGTYAVTFKQWRAVMGIEQSTVALENVPVRVLNWSAVQEFIQKLNAATGKAYRLPTEAEWEYAARGGSKSNGYKYSGGNTIGDVAWYKVNSGDKAMDGGILGKYIKNKDLLCELANELGELFGSFNVVNNNNGFREVGGKQPNELGIYDMSGNVRELVGDWYGKYASGSQTDPTGPVKGSRRVCRGGDCLSGASECRVSARSSVKDSDFGVINVGFRLALSP